MQINLAVPPKSREKETLFNRGEGWLDAQFSPDEFIDYINRGQAWCVSSLKNGKRNQKNFVSSQIIAIDLDSQGNTLADVLALPFFAEYGYAVLPSPSWKPDHQKFRIIYILDEPQADLKTHKRLILKVKQEHTSLNPDNAPSNPVTFFFGTAKNERQRRVPAKILPVAVVEKIELIKKSTPKTTPSRAGIDLLFTNGSTKNGHHKSTNGKERLIDWIVRKLAEGDGDGQKHETMGKVFYLVGGYIAGGALVDSDVQTILSQSGWLSLPWSKPDEVMRQVQNFVDNGKGEPLTDRWFDEPPKEVYGYIDNIEFVYIVDGENIIFRIQQLHNFCEVNGIDCEYDRDTKRQTFNLTRSQIVDWFEFGAFPAIAPPPNADAETLSDDEVYSLDSRGMAQYFMKHYGAEFLYLDTVLYYWNGKMWNEGDARRVRDKLIIRSMTQVVQIFEEQAEFDGDSGKKYNINATGIKSVGYILNTDGMIERIKFRDFKTDIYTINLDNGIFNFVTKKLTPHEKSANWTSIIDAEYIEDLDYSEWLEAYDKITLPNNPAIPEFNLYSNQQQILKMALGIGLFGKQNEHLFHLYGDGGSGKGTLLDSVLTAIGEEMAQPIQENTLMKPQQGQAFEVYQLKNIKMAFCHDIEAGKLAKSNVIKGLTGGGRISTAKKNHDGFSFDVKFDIWVTSEDLISAASSDGGFYRRYRMFSIPGGEEQREGHSDSRFKEKWANIPKHDKEGQKRRCMVLKWLIEGACLYVEKHHGTLPLTELQKQKIEELKGDNDTVTDWLTHALEIKDLITGDDYFSPSRLLYDIYLLHCELKKWKPETKTKFGAELKKNKLARENGITKRPKTKRYNGKPEWGFDGVQILDTDIKLV